MPGLGRRTFAPGEVLTATNVMGYLQDQAVMNFAGTAARGSAIGTAVSEGMVSYLADSDSVEIYNGSSWVRQTAGLIPISPSSVVIATGSGSANSLGAVTFTGATSVSFNDVFSSLYKNYKLVLTISAVSANSGLTLRMRSAGTDVSTTSYIWTRFNVRINGTTAVANTTGSNAMFVLDYFTTGYGNTVALDANIYNPHLAIQTTVNAVASGQENGAGFPGLFTSFNNCVELQSHDGISLVPASGTITGVAQIFGFND